MVWPGDRPQTKGSRHPAGRAIAAFPAAGWAPPVGDRLWPLGQQAPFQPLLGPVRPSSTRCGVIEELVSVSVNCHSTILGPMGLSPDRQPAAGGRLARRLNNTKKAKYADSAQSRTMERGQGNTESPSSASTPACALRSDFNRRHLPRRPGGECPCCFSATGCAASPAQAQPRSLRPARPLLPRPSDLAPLNMPPSRVTGESGQPDVALTDPRLRPSPVAVVSRLWRRHPPGETNS